MFFFYMKRLYQNLAFLNIYVEFINKICIMTRQRYASEDKMVLSIITM